MKKLEPRYSNSAGRLLAVLETINKGSYINELGELFFDSKQLNNNPSHNSILGVEVLTELHSLYAAFLKDMDKADIPDEEKNVLTNGLKSLNSLIYPAGVQNNMRQVSEAEKALLEVCATRLPKENVLSDDDFTLINESINELKATVKELPANSVLRTVLLELVRLSEDAINRFNIYGAKGLKKAFKGMLSEVAEIYLQDEEDLSAVKDTNAWKKATEHLKKVDSVASKVMKYKPLIEKASGFFIS